MVRTRPGIGIDILAGMARAAIGRNPDAAGQIRGTVIILVVFAEGLGVLAIVVGLLAHHRRPGWATAAVETTPVDILALAAGATSRWAGPAAEESGVSLQIDLALRVIVSAAELHRLPGIAKAARVQGTDRRPSPPHALAHRAGPQGRRAGAARPRVGRSTSAWRLPSEASLRGDEHPELCLEKVARLQTRTGDIAATRDEPAATPAWLCSRKDRGGEAAGDRRAARRRPTPRPRGRWAGSLDSMTDYRERVARASPADRDGGSNNSTSS